MHLDPAPQKSGITGHTCPVSGAGSNWVNGTEGPPLRNRVENRAKCRAALQFVPVQRTSTRHAEVSPRWLVFLSKLSFARYAILDFFREQAIVLRSGQARNESKAIRRGENHPQMV